MRRIVGGWINTASRANEVTVDLFRKEEGLMRLNPAFTAAALIVLIAMSVTAYGQEYRLEEGWPQLPAGMEWGGVISVDMDADGNIVVLRRAEPPIRRPDPDWSGTR